MQPLPNINEVPGIIIIDPSWPKPKIRVLAYTEADFFEDHDVSVKILPALLLKWDVVWIDVIGLGSETVLAELQKIFHLHKLALEDVTNLNQRPKAEEYEETLFSVLRRFDFDPELISEQLSFFLGQGFVLSFQENGIDCFHTIRNRIQNNQGRIRKSKADYLLYALLDAVVDSYFPIFEFLGEKIETLEDQIIQNQSNQSIEKIYHLRRDLITLRRAIWPLREMLSSLLRESTQYMSESTQVYLRDCYGHSVQLLDLVENYRELTNSMVDIYMSMISHKMNEVMRVLTIIATIFIPITFIAGIYGMNFNAEKSPWNLPELSWYYGYPLALLSMAFSTIGMLIYFYRKGWLSR